MIDCTREKPLKAAIDGDRVLRSCDTSTQPVPKSSRKLDGFQDVQDKLPRNRIKGFRDINFHCPSWRRVIFVVISNKLLYKENLISNGPSGNKCSLTRVDQKMNSQV